MMRDCPDASMRDLLPDFVHETLPAGEDARVAAHLAACEDCAAEVALIRSVRAAGIAAAPAMDVPRIVASLPGAGTAASGGGSGPGLWRIAAAIALVALGSLSVVALRGVLDRGADGVRVPAPRVAVTGRPGPDAGPSAKQVQVTSRGREVAAAPRVEGLSFGGGLSDLTDDQLRILLREIEALQAALSTEPEAHATPIVPLREGGNNAQ